MVNIIRANKICTSCNSPFFSERRKMCNPCRSKKRVAKNRICPKCHKEHISIYNQCISCKSKQDYQVQKSKTRAGVSCDKEHTRPGNLCNSCHGKYSRDNNPEQYKRYYSRNIEKCKEKTLKWRQNNKGRYLNSLQKYRITKQKATIKKYQKEVEEIYKNCPEGMTVDHVIPLQNKDITGLHVPWNLQYLTKSENSKKQNKFDYTNNNQSWRI